MKIYKLDPILRKFVICSLKALKPHKGKKPKPVIKMTSKERHELMLLNTQPINQQKQGEE